MRNERRPENNARKAGALCHKCPLKGQPFVRGRGGVAKRETGQPDVRTYRGGSSAKSARPDNRTDPLRTNGF